MEVTQIDEAKTSDVVFPIWIWDEHSDICQIFSVKELESCIHYRSVDACVDAHGKWHAINWIPVQVEAGRSNLESQSKITGWLRKIKAMAGGEAVYSARFVRGADAQYLRENCIGNHHSLQQITGQRATENLSRRMDRAYATHSIYISETIDLDVGLHGELAGCRIERPVSSLASGAYPVAGINVERGVVALADRFNDDGGLDLDEVGFSEDLKLGAVHFDSALGVVWAGALAGTGIEVAENLVLFFDEFFQIVGAVVKQT